MTDEELIRLIRSSPWSDGFPYLSQTADRIEALLAKAVDQRVAHNGAVSALEKRLAATRKAKNLANARADRAEAATRAALTTFESAVQAILNGFGGAKP